jgi:hypothetical protein
MSKSYIVVFQIEDEFLLPLLGVTKLCLTVMNLNSMYIYIYEIFLAYFPYFEKNESMLMRPCCLGFYVPPPRTNF